MITSGPAGMAVRAKLEEWARKQDEIRRRAGGFSVNGVMPEPSSQKGGFFSSPEFSAGMTNAASVFAEGPGSDDPWGAVVRGIAAWGQGAAAERRRVKAESKSDEAAAYGRSQDEREFALKEGESKLRTTAMQADLEAKAAERLRREQQIEAFRAAIPSMAPEDQQIAEAMAQDPALMQRWLDDQNDRKSRKAEFDLTFEETKRRNKVDESNDSRRLGMESERIGIAKEAAKQKGFDRRVVNGRLIVIDKATNQVVSEEQVPVSDKDRAALIQRHAAGNYIPLEQAAVEIDALLGSAPRAASPGSTPPATVDEILRSLPAGDPRRNAIEQMRRDPEFTDADILRAIRGQ